MPTIIAIIKKELQSYFNSPVAYIFITVFLVLSSWIFFRTFFLNGQASMRAYFSLLPWIFLFIIPAITMRLWAEEKKSGTIEILMTLPVKNYEIVLGKFFGSLVFLSLMLILTFPIPIIILMLGSADIGVIFASYLGTFFLGASYLSIGLFVSSFTNNQIISFIISIALCFALFIIGEEIVSFFVPQILVPLVQYLGLGTHFDSIVRGVVDSRDIIYYLSVIGISLYLNTRTIQNNS
ncbi:ABC transporter [Candidatus Peregrinibacteria bacterium RIFOXYB2_FULL_32_7]|nr:MAG: ABC transporter [Candidatus Peregrinibacteria bacterium RIFOXYB2_FULL_32_7]